MQTLMDLLVREYRKVHEQHDPGLLPGVEAFKTFADAYLAEHRPRATDHRTADNLGITLSNTEQFLLSPATASDKPYNPLRNVEVVGVHTAPAQGGGMDRVPATKGI